MIKAQSKANKAAGSNLTLVRRMFSVPFPPKFLSSGGATTERARSNHLAGRSVTPGDLTCLEDFLTSK